MTIGKLVLIRHGESQWNLENRFTGWKDIDLSQNGKIEAIKAGKILKEKKIFFDISYTSFLKRAIHTLWYVLNELDQIWIPVKKSWKLNERHYGRLQGLNKDETVQKYGEKVVNGWRRSFFSLPPSLDSKDQEEFKKDLRYINIKNLPNSENLSMTLNRVLSYWNTNIYQNIKSGKTVLIVAHGNSLRALVKFLENLNEEQIYYVNIPTGKPIIYEFNKNLNVTEKFFM